jgi:hypothetical protein
VSRDHQLVLAGGKKADCPHLPPYGDVKQVQQDVWIKVWTANGVHCQFHDGINHFEATARPCQGQHSDGTLCNKKLMLQCKFCPWTRLPRLKGGKFQTWTNPVACRDTGEVPRNAYTHVNGARQGGNRGWHQFWYAVHFLHPEVAGWAAAGSAAAGGAAGGGGPPGDRHLMIEWFARKVNDYRTCRDDFAGAGLLADGAEVENDIVDKFRMADEVLGMIRQVYPGMMAPPKAKRRLHLAPSRSIDADNAAGVACDRSFDLESFDDDPGASKRVKTEVFSSDRSAPADFDYAPLHALPFDYAPLHALPLPPAETDGMGCVKVYNILDQDPNFGEGLIRLDLFEALSPRAGSPCWTSSNAADGGAASGAAVQPLQAQHVAVTVAELPSLAGASATAPEDPTGGLGLHAHHRPVFNVFLDAMTGVVFQTPQSRDDWSSYDVNQDFERSLEFGLAQVIGAYLHRGEVSSPVLDRFYQALRHPDPAGPLAYFLHLQALCLQAPALMRVVTPSLGAIYCYWRIEHELLHTFYSEHLARWQGADIRGRLVDILRLLQQGVLADPALLEHHLVQFFEKVDCEIRLRLRECSHALRYFCCNTGSFAQVVRAPRIWCFFLVLRLRHDADFSRALWEKGFRFVAAHLDPLGVAPLDRDEWISSATGFLSGTSPGGGAGQGGGGKAANPFDDSRDPEKLVAQLLAAEGREVDVAARAEEGEDVELPPVSERKSLTAARLHLVSQGLLCVCWGRWVWVWVFVCVVCGGGDGLVGGWVVLGVCMCVCICACVLLCTRVCL